MDYAGAVGRGATVNGAVAAGGVTMFDAGTVWLVMALLMLAIGLAMVLISARRNYLDAVEVGIIYRPARRTRWYRR